MYKINKDIRIRNYGEYSLLINIRNNKIVKVKTKTFEYVLGIDGEKDNNVGDFIKKLCILGVLE